ncbi:MAG: DNA mismatch endonuclease Vsr [Rhizobiales bacterium]|nr:DNA mismatch endonuclease Vsr [Hyphomicrobiales bacterium]
MDTLTIKQRSDRMRLIRSYDTKPEIVVRKLVYELGYRFRLHRRDIPGHPDLAFIGRKKVIFVHGCFWHRHHCNAGKRLPKTRRHYWNPKFARTVERDKNNRERLKAQGWSALVIWECELKERHLVRRKIATFLKPRRSSKASAH